jgi:hypothetical protein
MVYAFCCFASLSLKTHPVAQNASRHIFVEGATQIIHVPYAIFSSRMLVLFLAPAASLYVAAKVALLSKSHGGAVG